MLFSKINWSDLFPTKFSVFIFIAYIFLFVNQGIAITASQSSKKEYNYNFIAVVLLTEVLKLFVSSCLYCKDNSFKDLITNIKKHKRVLALYLIPAFLYCLYNNLSFVNLSIFDPTTYFLLLQFRVVITAVLFQIFFKKQLSSKQWFSLILLTAGCMVKQFDFSHRSSIKLNLDWNIFLLLVQSVCSCLAGVYNEHLLKRDGLSVDIFVQNVFMYLDSILCNVLILILQGKLLASISLKDLNAIFHYKVLLIMVINCAIGIVTSFFLKSLNSILKTFASALELIFTAIASYFLFNISIHLNTVLAILIVSYAVILYSQNPVNNSVPVKESIEKEECELLMEEV